MRLFETDGINRVKTIATMKVLMKPTFFKTYTFVLLTGEDQPVLSSFRSYGSREECRDAIERMKEFAVNPKCYHHTASGIGGYYYYLGDEKGDPLAMSEIFSSIRSMQQSISEVIKSVSHAKIESYQEAFPRD